LQIRRRPHRKTPYIFGVSFAEEGYKPPRTEFIFKFMRGKYETQPISPPEEGQPSTQPPSTPDRGKYSDRR